MQKSKMPTTLKTLSCDSFLSSRYQILQIIGQGCFGMIVKAKTKKDSSICALKLQTVRRIKLKSILKNEIQILTKLQGRYGIPKILYYGKWQHGLYLQMELFEHDLNKPHKFSQLQIVDLTHQLLKIMNEIHDENIIHQDLKPHNIMKSKQNKLYIIDFGLSKYMDTSSGIKKQSLVRGFIGTPRYASVRAHNMLDQSKKDDLESLFYNIAFLFYQKLPWTKLNVSNAIKIEKIKILKIKHREQLFNEMPLPFQKAFEYITGLQPHEQPNYIFLRSLFKRNKTVLLDSQILNRQNRQNRSKRISLNMTDFLQIPDTIYEQKSSKSSKSNQGQSMSVNVKSFEMASDVAFGQFIQVGEFDQQNMQNCQSEGQDPQLPNISKYFQNFSIKNPFN